MSAHRDQMRATANTKRIVPRNIATLIAQAMRLLVVGAVAARAQRGAKRAALQLETDYNPCVLIGERIRAIREGKNLSQGDVEKRSGLLRVYVSRVENGHVIPALESLEKFARALEVPLYQLFYEGEEPPEAPPLLKRKTAEEAGMTRKEIRFWEKLRHLLTRMKESDRRLLLRLAQKMAGR
jgi:transcriptional regulator with XRE-family HTH domain